MNILFIEQNMSFLIGLTVFLGASLFLLSLWQKKLESELFGARRENIALLMAMAEEKRHGRRNRNKNLEMDKVAKTDKKVLRAGWGK